MRFFDSIVQVSSYFFFSDTMKHSLIVCLLSSLLVSCSLFTRKTEEEVIVIPSMSDEVTVETEDTTTPVEQETGVVTLELPTDTPKAIAPGGIMLPYTPTALVQAQGRIVLFFRASWSPASQKMYTELKNKKESIPKDITVLLVDFSDATDLRETFDVKLEHTFVEVDNDGKKLRMWRGGDTIKDLMMKLDEKDGGL
jgi:hypothetical protein